MKKNLIVSWIVTMVIVVIATVISCYNPYTVKFYNTTVDNQFDLIRFTVLKNSEPVKNNIYMARSFEPGCYYGPFTNMAGVYFIDWTNYMNGYIYVFVDNKLVATQKVKVATKKNDCGVVFESITVSQENNLRFTVYKDGKPVHVNKSYLGKVVFTVKPSSKPVTIPK